MRIVADISTSDILQVEKTPEIGEPKEFNGRFSLPVPDGAALTVTSASYILPHDANSVPAQAAAALLAQYPMYDHIFYNFFIEPADLLDLDLSPLPAVSAIAGYTVRTRVQTGNPGVGNVPNMTAILPRNDRIVPLRPGMLVTNMVDIGPMTGGAGADEFLLWWRIYEYTTTEDVMSDFGVFAGVNDPAYKKIEEVNQEPVAFNAFVSNDDGVTWYQAGRLQPTDVFVFDTDVRVAFTNIGSTKLYLAAYAVMF